MLPNLRFLICGILFCFLLFAVTGAGVMLPDARTRIGETPEIVRPMMQRSIVEASAQLQLYMATVARRSNELERLRERASLEIASAPAQPEPDLPKPAVTPDPARGGAAPDGIIAEDAEAAVQAAPADIARDRRPEAPEPLVAALAPSRAEDGASVAEGGEPVLRLVNVPLPQPRPSFFGNRRFHLFRRRHRAVLVQRDPPAAQAAPYQVAPYQAAPYQAAPYQVAPVQGATAQGWPAQGLPAATTATQAGQR